MKIFVETLVSLPQLISLYEIRHAAVAQFGLRNEDILPSPLERLLTDPSHTKLVSTYYRSFLHSTTIRTQTTKNRWCSDIPELTEDIWLEVLPLQVSSVISSRDKVMQTKLLYRVYYTPCLLQGLHRLPSSICASHTAVIRLMAHSYI